MVNQGGNKQKKKGSAKESFLFLDPLIFAFL